MRTGSRPWSRRAGPGPDTEGCPRSDDHSCTEAPHDHLPHPVARRPRRIRVRRDPAWRAALDAVPRELFLGDAVFRSSGGRWEHLRRRTAGDDEWLRLVHADKTWVTQVDGIAAVDASGSLSGQPTSSSTLPSLVVRMLDLAGVREGDWVLEVGTGTGYSTALLCHRLGDENVYSVEYDARLATAAPIVCTAPGAPPRCSSVTGSPVMRKPPSTTPSSPRARSGTSRPRGCCQVRAGGSVTVCLSGWMVASGPVRLTVHDDGTASGRFAGDRVGYMLARPHERPPRHLPPAAGAGTASPAVPWPGR
ncbi:hypothetical protein [Streptomyces sp. ISL-12]|uniref:hypothetical protein n=1 Tax=Streptomyces sp. ISL-12 TaxID=2819177 RepID=UPI0027B9588E|nr:hypothetical protein [Streptomyces sp. ISL-12]